ncbi:MAG TPA: hypothetical protein VKW08_22340 [Xanthobacteraceae bacterium]|jgi:hypothetical protein|nr:hypothetical protein [Xanthobacteraceae bacterium]
MRCVCFAAVLLVGAFRPAAADPQTCSAATEQYQSVLDEVSDAIRAYAMCVYDSQGGIDCADEFAGLAAAHEHFQSAVTLYQSECTDADPRPDGSPPRLTGP